MAFHRCSSQIFLTVAVLVLRTAFCERLECSRVSNGVKKCTDLDSKDSRVIYKAMINHLTHDDQMLRRFEFRARINNAHQTISFAALDVKKPQKLATKDKLEPWFPSYTVIPDHDNIELVAMVKVEGRMPNNTIENWHHFASVFDFHTSSLHRTVLNVDDAFGYRRDAIVGYLPEQNVLTFCGGSLTKDLPTFNCLMYNRSSPDHEFGNESLSDVISNEVTVSQNIQSKIEGIKWLSGTICKKVVADNELHMFCLKYHYVLSIPSGGKWTPESTGDSHTFVKLRTEAHLDPPRMEFATAAYKSVIVICGGYQLSALDQGHNIKKVPTDSCMKFDKKNPSEGWQSAPQMNNIRVAHTLLVIDEVGILAIGGYDALDWPIHEIELWPFGTKHWIDVDGKVDHLTDDHTLFWLGDSTTTMDTGETRSTSNQTTAKNPSIRYLSVKDHVRERLERSGQHKVARVEALQVTPDVAAMIKKWEKKFNGRFVYDVNEQGETTNYRIVGNDVYEIENQGQDNDQSSFWWWICTDPKCLYFFIVNPRMACVLVALIVLTVYEFCAPILDGRASDDVIFVWQWSLYLTLWSLMAVLLWKAVLRYLWRFVCYLPLLWRRLTGQQQRQRRSRRQPNNNNNDSVAARAWAALRYAVLSPIQLLARGTSSITTAGKQLSAFVFHGVVNTVQTCWMRIHSYRQLRQQQQIRVDNNNNNNDNASESIVSTARDGSPESGGSQRAALDENDNSHDDNANDDQWEDVDDANDHQDDNDDDAHWMAVNYILKGIVPPERCNDFRSAVQRGLELQDWTFYDTAAIMFEVAEAIRSTTPEIVTGDSLVRYLYTCARVRLLATCVDQDKLQAIIQLMNELEQALQEDNGIKRFPMLHLLKAKIARMRNNSPECIEHCDRGLNAIRAVHIDGAVCLRSLTIYPFSDKLGLKNKRFPESVKQELQEQLQFERSRAVQMRDCWD